MSQPDLGTKRVCVSCGARFYDLNRNPPVCPKCSTEQPELVSRLRRTTDSLAANPADTAPVKKNDDEDIDLDTDDDTDADDVMEDTSDLDDDDDDISSDIDVSTDSDEHDS